jgi:hypothetical protein
LPVSWAGWASSPPHRGEAGAEWTNPLRPPTLGASNGGLRSLSRASSHCWVSGWVARSRVVGGYRDGDGIVSTASLKVLRRTSCRTLRSCHRATPQLAVGCPRRRPAVGTRLGPYEVATLIGEEVLLLRLRVQCRPLASGKLDVSGCRQCLPGRRTHGRQDPADRGILAPTS